MEAQVNSLLVGLRHRENTRCWLAKDAVTVPSYKAVDKIANW